MSPFTSLLTVSIDWLIQVRYGSGDGKGLDELAKALKKLIEEAIEKAEKSLKAEKKKLECPFKYSDEETYCQYYQKKIDDTTKKLKESGKKSDEEIQNDYNVKFHTNSKNECQAKHSKYPESQAMKDVKSKLSQLEDLKKSLLIFTSDDKSEGCKNLLEKLSDGLEKFLGFNSESKGYDGSGIVYSDLDRLCDGVMGFLSGVLGAVKDDPSVKTYYNNMETTLQTIKNNMHKPGGLSKAVEAVSTALGAWDSKVTEKTSALKKALEYLKTDKFNNMHDSLNKLNAVYGDSLSKVPLLLDACIADAGWISGAYDIAEQEYKKLDPTLRDKLKDPINNIKVQVKSFVEAARNTELKKLLDVTRWQLDKVQIAIKNKVDEEIQVLKKNLETAFQNDIKEPIRAVNNKLITVNSDLEAWIREASNVIRAVLEKANSVFERLDHERLDARHAIGNGISIIKGAKERMSELKSKMDSGIDEVGQWNRDATGIVRFAQLKCDDILKRLNTDYTEDSKIHNCAAKLKYRATALLDAYDKAHGGLQKLADGIKEEVSNLKGFIVQDLSTLKEQVQSAVERHITGIINAVLNAAGAAKGSIYHGISTQGTKTLGTQMKIASDALGTLLDLGENDIADVVEVALHQLYGKIKPDRGSLASTTDLTPELQKFPESIIQEFKEKATTQPFANIETMNTKSDANFQTLMRRYHASIQEGKPLDKAIKKVTDALKHFEMDGCVDEPQRGVKQVDAKKKDVETFLKTIGDELNNIMKLFNNPGSFMQDNHRGLKTLLDDLKRGLGQNGTDKWGLFIKGLAKIKEDLNKFNNELPQQITLIESSTAAIKQELTSLRDEVLKSKDGSKEDIINTLNDLLKTGIQTHGVWKTTKNLQNIHSRIIQIIGSVSVSNAVNTLASLVTNAQKFHTRVGRETEYAITQIQSELSSQVAFAIKTVQTAAKDSYCDRMYAKFNDTKFKVDAETSYINGLINDDLATGVKGLFKIMKTKESCLDGINSLVTRSALKRGQGGPTHADFTNSSQHLQTYVDAMLTHIEKQTKCPVTAPTITVTSPPPTDPPTDPANKLTKIKDAFDKLLTHLSDASGTKQYNYDKTFVDLREDFKSSLTALSPSHFANPRHPELLDAVKKGLEGFVEELGRVYVNGYDSRVFIEDLVKKVENNNVKAEKQKIPDDDSSPKYMLTQYGEKCAKVCVTVLKNLYEYLRHLKVLCEGNGFSKEINAITQLGLFLQAAGYKVSTERNGQDGELRNSSDMQGQHIIGKLAPGIEKAKSIQHLDTCSSHEESKDNKFNVMGILKCILTHVDEYFTVRHRFNSSSKKNPCSVYEMLAWLTGLHYNSAYQDMLRDGVMELLYDPKKQNTELEDDFEFTAVDAGSLYFQAYPYNVSYNDISTAIDYLCSHAYDLLIAIAGTGDAYTRYGCEYYDNSLGLYYPTSGEDCLDMLLDVLRRVFPVFRFLYVRCSVPAKYYGWSDCQYGKEVKHSNWQCKDHSKSKSTCQTTCQPNDQPNCQPTSPLMSYLNDCLPGHLPHELSDIGCKAKCVTCPRGTKGMPCLTPCGFRTFSGSTKLGKHIYDIVSKFFGNGQPSVLFCMVAKAPSTLPEHFGFVLSLVKRWNNTETYPSKRAVESSIKNLSIELYKNPTDLTSALEKAYGSNQTSHVHSSRDTTSAELSSLCMETPCSGGNHCAPYLSSLHSDAYLYLAEKNADSYLSWAIYLPWNFWNLLNNLYNEFCSISCQDWGCRRCMNGDKCKNGKHGKDTYSCHCKSLLSCRGVAPTLYKCGFTLGNAFTLNHGLYPKTCYNLQKQLSDVLNSKYFADLLIQCDEYLRTIRAPFIWLNVALWLLSLLYLLHIMVIRLDLLHIKSHLHSPSSHRIAAQSLLAAARVNKLNRVFYLQP